MRESWLRGRGVAPVSYPTVDTIADGIAVRVPIPEAVDDMHGVVDDVLPIADADILRAMRLVFDHAGRIRRSSVAVDQTHFPLREWNTDAAPA